MSSENISRIIWRELSSKTQGSRLKDSLSKRIEKKITGKRKRTPRYPAFARTHALHATHIERHSHSLGLEIQLGLRMAARICIRIYVHVTLSYTISLGFAATSIKTWLPPLHPHRDLPFALNSWVLSRGNANCAERMITRMCIISIYTCVFIQDYSASFSFSLFSSSRTKPRAGSRDNGEIMW